LEIYLANHQLYKKAQLTDFLDGMLTPCSRNSVNFGSQNGWEFFKGLSVKHYLIIFAIFISFSTQNIFAQKIIFDTFATTRTFPEKMKYSKVKKIIFKKIVLNKMIHGKKDPTKYYISITLPEKYRSKINRLIKEIKFRGYKNVSYQDRGTDIYLSGKFFEKNWYDKFED